jgi:hypothetical protein
MRKSRLSPGLLVKLSKKTGKSEKYLREQISTRANRNGVSSEAYFVYWLTKEKIHCAVYQRSLSNNIRNEIRGLIDKEIASSRTPSRRQKIQSVAKVFRIKRLKIKPKPTLSCQKLIKNAQENAELYPALFIFENSVRNFVRKVLEKKYGERWWKNRVSKDIKKRVEQRIQTEKMNKWHGARGGSKIYYTDFSDLSTIIKNNAGVFNNYFKGIRGKTNWLTQKLDELALSRHNIAHVCPLQTRDRQRFLLYFKDWYDQIDNLNKLIN